VPQEQFAKSLVPVLPEGLRIKQVQEVQPGAPAMQTQVIATEYRVVVDWDAPAEAVTARVGRLLAETELPHQRSGKRYDLRPLIERLQVEEVSGGEVVLHMRLSARPGATARPEAVLDTLGLGDAFARYRRTRLILDGPG